MVIKIPSSSNYRLSSSLSPARNESKTHLQEYYSKTINTKMQTCSKNIDYYFDNNNCVSVNINEGTQSDDLKLIISQSDFLIYDKNLFRFKIFVVILLYISRSIIETRHIINSIDYKTHLFLKNIYHLSFFACIFAFTYIAGKSFTTSILTINKISNFNHSNGIFYQRFPRFFNIFTHSSLKSIKIVVYKSITKYFLTGFLMLYFIQPFSYYISLEYPIWAERITLSPINFFLDSLDRIIYKANLDTTCKKISYFPQVLIYLSFIRIICFPITELTKYLIECSLNETNNSELNYSSGDCSSNADSMEAVYPYDIINTNNNIVTNMNYIPKNKHSNISDIYYSNNIMEKPENLNSPLLAKKLKYKLTDINNTRNQIEYYFHQREFSFISLIGKATIPICVILMLYYFKLGEFSMLVFIPMALPVITFSLAGHLSSVSKVQISLALTYIVLLFLLIPLKDYSLIWKLCLIFLLGATDTQLSFMRSQYNNCLSKNQPIHIIHPILKSISLLVFSLTTIYLVFFISEDHYFQNWSLYMNALKEISLLLFLITITSHPFFRSELLIVENSFGIKQIKRENRNLFIIIFLHSIAIRIVSFLFESKSKLELPVYIYITAISAISILLSQVIYNLLLVISYCGSYLKSYFFLKVNNSN